MARSIQVQAPSVSYNNYELTDADEEVLCLLLNYDNLYFVQRRDAQDQPARAMLVVAIKWFRVRFGTSLMEAKQAIEHFMNTTPPRVVRVAKPVESLGKLLRERLHENGVA